MKLDENLKTSNNLTLYMNNLSNFKKRVAECIGLWLAEGSTRSKSEITFTNNCWNLIDLFYRTINRLFKSCKYNIRIYVYSKDGTRIKMPYTNCAVKYYIHKRATKPFFILRLASVEIVRKWSGIINDFLKEKEVYPFVLRGFFAGEGNVKESSHNSRVIRISQGKQKEFIDNILNELGLNFSFNPKNRNYIIRRKSNWDIFAKLKLANLHPIKKKRFWEVYNKFKEEHYEHNYLIKNILPTLNELYTTKQLAEKFNRSPARVRDILVELKKQGKIMNFRVGSVDYWTNDPDLILISKLKYNYLFFLDEPRQTSEFAKHFKVCWKSPFKRLKELERLNLVRRQEDGKWIKLLNQKKIAAI